MPEGIQPFVEKTNTGTVGDKATVIPSPVKTETEKTENENNDALKKKRRRRRKKSNGDGEVTKTEHGTSSKPTQQGRDENLLKIQH